MTVTDPPPGETGQRDSRPASTREWLVSLGWVAAGKWGVQIFSWTCSIVIARVLSPEDFGLVNMTTVIIGIASLIAEAGIGAAILNLPDLEESEIRQMNSLSAVLGIAVSGLLIGGSSFVASFYSRREVGLLLSIMSLPLILSSVRAVPNALLQKTLRFKLLSMIDAAQGLAQVSVTLALALAGFGYWSLVLGSIVAALLSTVGTLWAGHVGFELPRFAGLRHIARFSSAVLLSNLSWFAYSRADFVVAGKMLGAMALGHYSLAWNLAMVPSDKVNSVLTRVAPGFLAQHGASVEGIRRDLCRLTKGIALLVVPAGIGLALVAEVFVATLLGEKWRASANPLRYLSIYLVFSGLSVVVPQAAVSAGRPSLSMFASFLKLLVLPVAFYIGSSWGAEGIALAWLIAGIPTTVPLYVSTFRHLHLSLWEYFSALKTPFAATGIMTIIVGVVNLVIAHKLSPALSLMVQVSAGATAYLAVVVWREPVLTNKVTRAVRQKIFAAS